MARSEHFTYIVGFSGTDRSRICEYLENYLYNENELRHCNDNFWFLLEERRGKLISSPNIVFLSGDKYSPKYCSTWWSKILQGLLNDPFYTGLRRKRVRGEEYDMLIDNFMRACTKRWISSVYPRPDFYCLHKRFFDCENLARVRKPKTSDETLDIL